MGGQRRGWRHLPGAGRAGTAPAGLIASTDPRLVATAAGLGLFGSFTGATATALQEPVTRVPAAVTLLVTASGVTALGLGAAPLGLAAGLVALAVLRPVAPRPAGQAD